MVQLLFTSQSDQYLNQLEIIYSLHKRCKAVKKALGVFGRHPSLNTPQYSYAQGPSGEEVFEAYEKIIPPQLTVYFGTIVLIKNKLHLLQLPLSLTILLLLRAATTYVNILLINRILVGSLS
ncbi:hypothetical protein OQJ13_16080 [Legionella sp. PATHC035]|uniref:hypothetical protein n=1 Tax=Legionella sp. PATHC035 TaxID=2992040 RepID=UPI0022444277|nr:hypothetical protein [Legionella sp. PATHC035]MCW8410499.1 hypothetical protein [Legionella sp. PATHC035]